MTRIHTSAPQLAEPFIKCKKKISILIMLHGRIHCYIVSWNRAFRNSSNKGNFIRQRQVQQYTKCCRINSHHIQLLPVLACCVDFVCFFQLNLFATNLGGKYRSFQETTYFWCRLLFKKFDNIHMHATQGLLLIY